MGSQGSKLSLRWLTAGAAVASWNSSCRKTVGRSLCAVPASVLGLRDRNGTSQETGEEVPSMPGVLIHEEPRIPSLPPTPMIHCPPPPVFLPLHTEEALHPGTSSSHSWEGEGLGQEEPTWQWLLEGSFCVFHQLQVSMMKSEWQKAARC